MSASDPYRTFDAAYVLGALSPQDRSAYEVHLRECDDCARSVRELAGMPGLLGPVPATGQAPGPEPPLAPGERAPQTAPSGSLLPALLERVTAQRRRHRRALTLWAGASVGLAACLAVVLTAPLLPGGGEGPRMTAMTPLGAYPVEASIGMVDTEAGVKVSMECDYGSDADAADPELTVEGGGYVLVAVERDGGTEELTRWYALPGETAEMTVGTPLHRGDIAALEIRVPGGPTVLRMTL